MNQWFKNCLSIKMIVVQHLFLSSLFCLMFIWFFLCLLIIRFSDDILRAVEKIKVLGNGFELIPFLGSGRFMIQSVPGELSMDHSRVLQLAEDTAYVTKVLVECFSLIS